VPPVKEKTTVDRARKPKDERGPYFVQVVGKALDIIELVGQSVEPLSLAQIARAVRQSKSSVFRVLCTLERKGILVRKPGDLYAATHAANAATSHQSVGKLLRVAEPAMRELAREFRETVSMAVLFENHIGVVAVTDSPQKIRMGNVVGGLIPPYASSLGKCITAHQTEAIRDHLLRTYGINPFTPNTITDEAQLDEEYRRVREQGFAVDREESTLYGCCFAAPIWTSPDRVTAAISVSFPKARLCEEEVILNAVRGAAEAISGRLREM